MRSACFFVLLLGVASIGCSSHDAEPSNIRYDAGDRRDTQLVDAPTTDAPATDSQADGDAADASECATECVTWCTGGDPECPNPGCNCSDLQGACGVGEGSICCPADEGTEALTCAEGFDCCGGLCTFGERAGCGEGYSCPTKCEERCAIDRTPCPIPAGCSCN